jgi:putative PEP-CTERM system histidine kinase
MERLYGVMILGRPRVSRQLAWEDFDLLKTVTRQAASYLAEQDTSEALAAARQFEAFNKRFAFVIHDIKNLASQLSLILSNAEKHRGNVQFQNDMIETVRQSVEKINRMLKQLHAEPERSAPRAAVELAALLSDIVATQKQLGPDISLELRANGLSVAADEDRLKAVVEQLVQNAVDAVGGKGRVQVRLAGEGKMAVIEVEDDGPGMDDEFVRDKLFHPFATTKGVGYGIGAYESRDFASSLGGRLEVTSQPGRGTIMRMRLPAIGLP